MGSLFCPQNKIFRQNGAVIVKAALLYLNDFCALGNFTQIKVPNYFFAEIFFLSPSKNAQVRRWRRFGHFRAPAWEDEVSFYFSKLSIDIIWVPRTISYITRAKGSIWNLGLIWSYWIGVPTVDTRPLKLILQHPEIYIIVVHSFHSVVFIVVPHHYCVLEVKVYAVAWLSLASLLSRQLLVVGS